MKRGFLIFILIFFLVSCAPSPSQIQNAVNQTLTALPTRTPLPTYTPYPTINASPTATVQKTKNPSESNLLPPYFIFVGDSLTYGS